MNIRPYATVVPQGMRPIYFAPAKAFLGALYHASDESIWFVPVVNNIPRSPPPIAASVPRFLGAYFHVSVDVVPLPTLKINGLESLEAGFGRTQSRTPTQRHMQMRLPRQGCRGRMWLVLQAKS